MFSSFSGCLFLRSCTCALHITSRLVVLPRSGHAAGCKPGWQLPACLAEDWAIAFPARHLNTDLQVSTSIG
jgi:hypothetical protein